MNWWADFRTIFSTFRSTATEAPRHLPASGHLLLKVFFFSPSLKDTWKINQSITIKTVIVLLRVQHLLLPPKRPLSRYFYEQSLSAGSRERGWTSLRGKHTTGVYFKREKEYNLSTDLSLAINFPIFSARAIRLKSK